MPPCAASSTPPAIAPAAGRRLAALGIGADQLALLGLFLALAAAGFVVIGQFVVALLLVVLSLLARAARATGSRLDTLCDCVFHGAMPLAFALHDPAQNAVAAAVLLFAFYLSGTSRREPPDRLIEGAEIILIFLAMLIWPGAFAPLAILLAAALLVAAGIRLFRDVRRPSAD
jgi:chromate transport protein ChrA